MAPPSQGLEPPANPVRFTSEGKGKEVDLFLKTIEELYSDIVKLIGIQELADGQQFVFCSLYGSEDLSLSFSKPQERRKSIADDIQTMFAFTKM